MIMKLYLCKLPEVCNHAASMGQMEFDSSAPGVENFRLN